MRLPCPSCSVTYDVPDVLLVTARMVRCASCGHEWLAEPIAPPPSPAPAPEPVLIAPPEKLIEPQIVTPPRQTGGWRGKLTNLRENRVVLIGWVVSLLLLIWLGREAITHRGGIMAVWPPSRRLFALLGLAGGG